MDILGPADRLELATPRPIEIGYSASDDFGVGIVELVYRAGDRPEQRVALRDGAARARSRGERCGIRRRRAWAAPSASLTGSRRAIATTCRRAGGAMGKSGSSRTLYVIIQNPHESLEDRLERQRDLLEKLIGDLAQRPGARPAGDDAGRGARRLRGAHDAEESHLALLGQLIDEDRRNGTLGKTLRAALTGVADRLEHELREEAKVIAALKGKPPRRRRCRACARCRPATSRSWRTTCCCSTI